MSGEIMLILILTFNGSATETGITFGWENKVG